MLLAGQMHDNYTPILPKALKTMAITDSFAVALKSCQSFLGSEVKCSTKSCKNFFCTWQSRPLGDQSRQVSVLLEMIPKEAPSAHRLLSRGANMGALSHNSSCLVRRAARSPGVAVSVPSKSKKITATPAAREWRKSSRTSVGDSGPNKIDDSLPFKRWVKISSVARQCA